MENPQGWDALTACLASSRLADTAETWAFLVHAGMIRGGAADEERFRAIVRGVLAEGPITGPSEAWRVGAGIRRAGMEVEAAAGVPDPWGRSAQALAERFRAGRKT